MFFYLLKRASYLILTLVIASMLTFVVVNVIPGEPAEVLVRHLYTGLEEVAPPELIAEISERYDLNKPLLQQYIGWVGGILHGDLGYSILFHKQVDQLLMLYLPPTIMLTIAATAFSTVIGLILGTYSALHQNSMLDHVIRIGSIFFMSMPGFWVAVMLILVFSIWFKLTPVSGYGSPQCIILPAIALGLHTMASVVRIMRTSMLETMEKPFVIFARVKGLSMGRVIFSHAYKNAFLPVLTVIGMSFSSLLAGSVVIETIFSWPGIGALLVRAIFAHDLVLVESIIVIIIFMFLIVNFMIDILYHIIDPRIVYE